ncbi:MAG: hypothetical protein HUU41_07135 [Bryobacteraceae bacterium]|nr:hypothetical protein [Bryobacterales bacterium]MEB2362934.1 hypothetical protein [Bryobacterales bacterium]NUN00870.1 hypothetical protein [Bryobacteraceae bacterium]
MRYWNRRQLLRAAASFTALVRSRGQDASSVHPRALITPEMVWEMVEKVKGPFAAEYRMMLETASLGPRGLDNRWGIPAAFMEAGLAYQIERASGRDGQPFAGKILNIWRDPEWQKPGLRRHFGWQGLLYDWIYDAMTDAERNRFGELLGEWVATWWNNGEVNIPRSGWWYNQHWGPAHLDEANHRVALLAKLLIDLAVMGHAGKFEDAVRRNLETFRARFLSDGLPALDEMGGIWSESSGHGNYGPLLTVILGYQAVKSGLDFDPFEKSAPHGFAREYIQAAIYGMMPHNGKLAYIDDSSSGYPNQQARAAPLFARHYGDRVARWFSDLALEKHWLRSSRVPQDEVWQRIAFLPENVLPQSPAEAEWPLACLFRGAGHVYMRSAWNDANATWAFFGAGPSYAGHSRDDEGHFLITRRGHVVNRSGGAGHNDNCYYSGGSLIYNIMTVYHPDEQMRRTQHNENDGGLIRYVYSNRFPMERGHLTAFWHDDSLATYAAADLTKGYWAGKVCEVTRQFLYLRGAHECFVIFDRVEATAANLPKVWMLHLPAEPEVDGTPRVIIPEHVTAFEGSIARWWSDMAGDTDAISQGRTRAVLQAVAPRAVRITKRGGDGHDFWGHPYNPAAQYNHTLDIKGVENEAYRRPPYSPWRLEVEPVESQVRDYFLHVLFLKNEGDPDGAGAERIEQQNRLGAHIPLGSRSVTVLFELEGPPGGRLTIADGGRTIHEAELAREIPRS